MNFNSDIPDGPFALPEEGTGSGLIVSFDTFNNGGPANEAPAIEVTFGNRVIATKLVDYLSTGTGFVPASKSSRTRKPAWPFEVFIFKTLEFVTPPLESTVAKP